MTPDVTSSVPNASPIDPPSTAGPVAVLPSEAGSQPHAPDGVQTKLASLKSHAEEPEPASGAQEQASSVELTEAEKHPVEIATLRMIFAPLLLASLLRQRTGEALQTLVNHLPIWLTGGPPSDPPPSAEAAGSGGAGSAPSAASLPRPPTIPRGWPQRGPNGEQYSFSEASAPEKPVWGLNFPTT